MRKSFSILLSAVILAAAGCASHSGNSSAEISDAQVPEAVKAAFESEHPYATMDHPKMITEKGNTVYEIPYSRADGTQGTARYGSMGELMVELQKD